MLNLRTLRVESFDLDSMTLTWEWSATSELVAGYGVDIYRSISPSGIWECIASGINADLYSYTDVTVSGIYNTWNDWYYRFRVYSGQTEYYTSYDYFRAERDQQAKYMIREKMRGMSLYASSFWVLKRRSSGTQCTSCWDPILFRPSPKKYCLTCYDTGFFGGYHNPIAVWGVVNPQPKRHQITAFGEFHPGDNLITFGNYPRIAPRDIIIDSLNKRWRVVNPVIPTEKKRYLIAQQCRVEQVDLGDVVYKYLIDRPPSPNWKSYRNNY